VCCSASPWRGHRDLVACFTRWASIARWLSCLHSTPLPEGGKSSLTSETSTSCHATACLLITTLSFFFFFLIPSWRALAEVHMVACDDGVASPSRTTAAVGARRHRPHWSSLLRPKCLTRPRGEGACHTTRK
jgi:hypothetical protein